MTVEVKGAMASDADSVATLIDAFRLMIRRLPNGAVEETGGVASLFGHVPLAFFNMSVLNRPMMDMADFRGAIDLACARARGCAHSSFIALCPAWIPIGADEIIAQAG